MDHHQHARAVAGAVAENLEARAVALTGSVATGADHPDSDIDLIAVTDRPRQAEVRSVEGRMVTIGWKSPQAIEGDFADPAVAGVAVPTWRAAVVLTDPDRLLAGIRSRAETWTWGPIADRADRWAAAGIVGLAEETHKVAGMLATGNLRAAAANRDILTLQLPGLVAAADRVLYISENALWDAVCEAEGPDWARAWDTAAALTPAGLEASCRAAMRLYRLAAARLDPVFTGTERPVVATACALAEAAGG